MLLLAPWVASIPLLTVPPLDVVLPQATIAIARTVVEKITFIRMRYSVELNGFDQGVMVTFRFCGGSGGALAVLAAVVEPALFAVVFVGAA